MTFARVNPGGWALYEVLTSAQMNQLDINVSNAVDGGAGGTYNPSAPLTWNEKVTIDDSAGNAGNLIAVLDVLGSQNSASTGNVAITGTGYEKEAIGVMGKGSPASVGYDAGTGLWGVGGTQTTTAEDGGIGVRGYGSDGGSTSGDAGAGGYFVGGDGAGSASGDGGVGAIGIAGTTVAGGSGIGLAGFGPLASTTIPTFRQASGVFGIGGGNGGTGGVGVWGDGGNADGTGVVGFGGTGNGDGTLGQASGTGAGVIGRGLSSATTPSSGTGVFGEGSTAGGYGVEGIGGAGSGTGGRFTGTGSGEGVQGVASGSAVAIRGTSSSGAAIYGNPLGSGTGVIGSSSTGYGMHAVGNATSAPFRMTPQAAPSAALIGDMYIDSSGILWSCTNAVGPVFTKVGLQT